MAELEIGKVRDFFSHPVVAGVDLTGDLELGDTVHILGHTTDLEFRVESMQIDNHDVMTARSGQAVGIKVPERVRAGDTVYRVGA